jgi:hypothetical protein
MHWSCFPKTRESTGREAPRDHECNRSGFSQAPGGTFIGLDVYKGDLVLSVIPMIFGGQGGNFNLFGFNQPVLLFCDAGETPIIKLVTAADATSGVNLHLSGYLLDCTTAPCAAIAP